MGERSIHFYWSVITAPIVLVTLGLVTLLSIDQSAFFSQFVFFILGIILLVIFSRIDFSTYKYLDRFLYVGCILFLLVSYLGPNIRGATRWISVSGFQIQPSELSKPFLLLSFASFMISYPPTNLRRILAHVGLFIIPFFIVMRQPDLGSSLIYASLWIGLIILAGIPLRYLVAAALVFILVLPTAYELLHDYQKQRIMTFINPTNDPRGAGYNAIQSMIAVGSGRLLGRGFGRGTQSQLQFLPERHTDFIFASFVEEFGFVGSTVLLGIFFYELLQLVKLAESRQDYPMAHLYLVGFFLMLFSHVFINIGMNIGLLPITGITLPFVSAGGSSLLTMFICLGIAIASLQKKHNFE